MGVKKHTPFLGSLSLEVDCEEPRATQMTQGQQEMTSQFYCLPFVRPQEAEAGGLLIV